MGLSATCRRIRNVRHYPNSRLFLFGFRLPPINLPPPAAAESPAARGRDRRSMSNPTFLEFFAGGGMAHAGLRAGVALPVRQRHRRDEGRHLRAQLGRGGRVRRQDISTLTGGRSAATRGRSSPGRRFPAGPFAGGRQSRAGGRGRRSARVRARSGRSGISCANSWRRGARTQAHRARKCLRLPNFASRARTSRRSPRRFRGRGYRFGAVIVDAARFVPQSRPRAVLRRGRGTARPCLPS